VAVVLTLSVWYPEWFSAPVAAPKPPVRRVTRVIGFAIVAAGLSIMFLPVSAQHGFFNVDCGSAWQAMFTDANGHNVEDFGCGRAAFPHVWVAGGVAAVGVGVAFWGASRGRILAVVGLTLLATSLVLVVALMSASSRYGGA
jgi:hypothetical protein